MKRILMTLCTVLGCYGAICRSSHNVTITIPKSVAVRLKPNTLAFTDFDFNTSERLKKVLPKMVLQLIKFGLIVDDRLLQGHVIIF